MIEVPKLNIGDTPLVMLSGGQIVAKAEFYNPSGSIKDRMARFIIQDAFDRSLLKKGDWVIEATSGNTGISLAWLMHKYHYRLKVIMPCNMSEERKSIIRKYGGKIIQVAPNDFAEAVEKRDELVKKYGAFTTNQFKNPLNIACHYATTGQEILKQVGNREISALVAGTGTGGTLMGIRLALMEKFPKIKTIAVEPFESAVMSGFDSGKHEIQGIGDGFIPPIVEMSSIDYVYMIRSRDAIKKAISLKSETGYFVGVSSGANILAAERYVKEHHPRGLVVSIFPDSGDRYQTMFNNR